MNLKALQEILDCPFDDAIKEQLILDELAGDPQIVPYMLRMIQQERKETKEVILDMNVLLSKSKIAFDNEKIYKTLDMSQEIFEFFKKMGYKFGIGYTFKETNPKHIVQKE